MYNVNGMKATLIRNNRNESSIYDDQDKTRQTIVVCPYSVDQAVRFGIYTIPEATGYFIVKSKVPIKEGDQIEFKGTTFSVLHVKDNWIWNKLANISVAVK